MEIHHPMSTVRAFLAVLGLVGLSAACTPASVTPSNLVAAAQTVAATATTVVDDAEEIWPILLLTLPPASQPAAQTAFNSAVFDANHAILALDDAIQATIALGGSDAGSAPNLTAAISAVAGAIANIVLIVQNLQSTAAVAHLDAGREVLGDMAAHANKLRAIAGDAASRPALPPSP